jgi:hypothetical protein
MAEADETKSFEPYELEKIKLLLSSEYKNLSDQIISRFHGQQQVYRLAATLLGGLISAWLADYIKAEFAFPALFIALFVLAILWLDMDRDVAKAVIRMREIEARVNKASHEDRLLVWETEQGRGGVVGKHLVGPEISN